jgi:hypothetical protein
MRSRSAFTQDRKSAKLDVSGQQYNFGIKSLNSKIEARSRGKGLSNGLTALSFECSPSLGDLEKELHFTKKDASEKTE